MRSFVRSTRSLLLVAAILLASNPLAAAPQVYSDPAGVCNGQAPCFTTIADAVANAGPAPANVGIFPGTYAESVDLSAMGSAIAGSPGPLTIEALDAAGNPATSGVTIDPPAGLALTTGMGTPFPGDLVLRGLAVTSPDTTAMGLIVDGDLVIEDLTAENSAGNGVVAVADGSLTVERVLATLNADSGLIAASPGEVVLRDVIGLRNGGTGLAVQGEAGVLLDGVEAEFNEDGLEAASCNALVIADSLVGSNMLTGGTLEAGTPSCAFAGIFSHPALQGLDLPAFEARGAGGGTGTPSITATTIVAENNGDYGLTAVSLGGPATLNDAAAFDNTGIGLGVIAEAAVLVDLQAIGNRTGILVQADTVDALRIDVSDSLPMPANPPLDGTGLVVIAASVVLEEIQSEFNPEIGLLIGQSAPGSPVDVELLRSSFNGNRIGVAATADVPLSFTADNLFIDNHTAAGMIVSNIGDGLFARVDASGNALGLFLGVTGSARVERSQFDGNASGVGLALETFAQAAVVCSDFIGNTTGLELAQGDAADARANYWGEPSGPTHPGNAGGTGDPVVDGSNGGVGTAVYTPFLTAPATDADCPTGFADPVAVPTLGPWSLALLVLLIGTIALVALRGAVGRTL